MKQIQLENYMMYAGASMLASGILLFILIVFLKGYEKKQDWYYALATPWEKFTRRTKSLFIAFFWIISAIGELFAAYEIRYESWCFWGREMFLVGMAIASLAMCIRSLQILFEKYKNHKDLQETLDQQT